MEYLSDSFRKSFEGQRPLANHAAGDRAKILFVDPRSLTRNSLGRWLSSNVRDRFVVGLVETIEEAIAEASRIRPSLILYHIGSRGLESSTVAQGLNRLRSDLPDVPVAVLADSESDGANAIRTALLAGLRGYIPTSLSDSMVLQAICLVCGGDTYAPAASLLQRAFSQQPRGDHRDASEQSELFSPRQIQVLQCLRRGTPNKMIAYELSMSQGTVKVHIRNIMKRLGARNRTQVVMMTADLFD